MWAVPGPVASMSNSTFSGGSAAVAVPVRSGGSFVSLTLWMLMLSFAGAGLRPEIGTPSVADW